MKYRLILSLLVAASSGAIQADDGGLAWKRIKLDDAFRSEGVAAFDVNKDGKVDVVAGDVWYEAPEWKMHSLRKQPKTFVAGVGYSDSFVNYSYDVNGDGWEDLIYIGFPGAPFSWCENPKNEPGYWKEHLIWHSVCNESPTFLDVTDDGKPDLLIGSQPESCVGYLPLPAAGESANKWAFHPIGVKGEPLQNGSHMFYHGIGAGDFNGDGRTDVFIRHGWWEAPQDRAAGPWPFHPFEWITEDKEHPPECAHMYADDVDLDGDMDILCSSAHSYGVWWFENVDGKKMKQHVIDKSCSQTHALLYVDINGDGRKEMVTGKRYFAHNGHDPGEFEPVMMLWYDVQKSKGHSPTFTRHEIKEGLGTGVGTQFQITDVDGDNRADIVLSNKKGVNVIVQTSAGK